VTGVRLLLDADELDRRLDEAREDGYADGFDDGYARAEEDGLAAASHTTYTVANYQTASTTGGFVTTTGST
jgi:hypothetical protein